MRLIEFDVIWLNDYTKEQISVYEINYGEDRNKWPETSTEGFVLIDIDSVLSANTHSCGNCVVRMTDGYGYILKHTYEEVKIIFKKLGLSIESYAVSNINE